MLIYTCIYTHKYTNTTFLIHFCCLNVFFNTMQFLTSLKNLASFLILGMVSMSLTMQIRVPLLHIYT